MVWIPKVGQTVKPKDGVHTSSVATTCHTSEASKGIGKNQKMIWVPKGSARVEGGVKIRMSKTGTNT